MKRSPPENNRSQTDQTVWGVLTSAPSVTKSIPIGWAMLGITAWLADEYLLDLLWLAGLADIYGGSASVVTISPLGVIGAPTLAIVAPLSVALTLIGWSAMIHRYYNTTVGEQSTWRDDLAVVRNYSRNLVSYLVLVCLAVIAGPLLFVLPGVYLAGRLLPGTALILGEGQTVTTALQESLDATADIHITTTLWVSNILIIGIVIAELVAVWFAVPIMAIGLAALSVKVAAS